MRASRGLKWENKMYKPKRSIVRYKNAVQKVEEIGGEIKRNFGGDFPFRVKGMAKDHFNTSEAKKSLDFGDTPSAASPGTPTNLHVGETSAEINIDRGRGISLSPIPLAGFAPTQSFVPVFVQSSSQYLVQKAFPGFGPGFAFTPRISRLNNKNQSQETSLQESSKETKGHLTVVYPSRVSRGDWLGNPANFKGACYCYGFRVVTWY